MNYFNYDFIMQLIMPAEDPQKRTELQDITKLY